MKKILFVALLCCVAMVSTAQTEARDTQKAKYVFYFIGDGMGAAQVQLGGGDSLCFSSFPAKGTIATRSESDEITDSAAAGTALATGHKTANKRIGMSTDKKTKLRSVAYDAKDAGLRVAIMSTVSLDHATPAAFYASVPTRSMAYEIASQLPATGFELFAGAGFVRAGDLFDVLRDSAYTVVRGRDAVLAGEKVVWIQAEGKNVGELPFAVRDRRPDDMTLPEMTARAIEFFAADTTRGFFMMIEGGKIDWAGHANNDTLMRGEVIDFAGAVGRALDFYERHKDQTLIVVTADHETGGLSLNPTAWSSTDHTAADVPIYAIGVGAEKFAGARDNTSVAPTIRGLIE